MVALDREDRLAHPQAIDAPYLRIQVADNGAGIGAAIRERIFEPFFTTKEVDKGSGLGLATVYATVHNHRGWIECDSQPGAGTTFSIFLPAIPGKRSVERPPEVPGRAGPPRRSAAPGA